MRVWEGQLPGVWSTQGVDPAEPGRHPGGPLHGGALMGGLGIRGAVRGRKPITTRSVPSPQRHADLMDRDFSAPAPNRKWVADFTYVRTRCGFVYVAFIIDCYARRIVGWDLARHMTTDLVLTAGWSIRQEKGVALGVPTVTRVGHGDSTRRSLFVSGRLALVEVCPPNRDEVYDGWRCCTCSQILRCPLPGQRGSGRRRWRYRR